MLDLFSKSENAKIFWRDYVKEKGYNITATKCVNYFEEYIHNFNVKEKPEDRILTDRIDLIFQELFDQDGDGKISINEIGIFFTLIWDNKKTRKQINLLSKDQAFDEKQYLLLT